VLPAWREFRQSVMPGNIGSLILFLVMNFILMIGVAIGRALVGCATCCIGFLPYLSSVAALPLLVFARAYSVYYLQQFSPRYLIVQEPAPPTGFPVIQVPGQYPPGQYPPDPYGAPQYPPSPYPPPQGPAGPAV